MSEENIYTHQSSSSSLNSSHDTEETITIAAVLSNKVSENASLGKRLLHLDSIPVCSTLFFFDKCMFNFVILFFHSYLAKQCLIKKYLLFLD